MCVKEEWLATKYSVGCEKAWELSQAMAWVVEFDEFTDKQGWAEQAVQWAV